jgi:hypothetical protein
MRNERTASRRLIGLIAAGVAFQCAVLFIVMDPHQLFWPDARQYYTIAQDLADGLPYSTPANPANLYQSPGYPFILSLFIRLAGSDLVRLLLLHVAIFPLFLYSLFRLGTEWKGRRVGLITVLIAVFYPYYIYQPLTMYPESLLMYLLPPAALLALELRKTTRYRYAIMLSMLVATMAMIRPTTLCIVPALLFLVKRGSPIAMNKFSAFAAIIISVPLIAVSSWMLRNEVVHGEFIFSTAGAENLLLSYNENASWSIKRNMLPAEIQMKLKNSGSVFERSRIASGEAEKFMGAHPLQALGIAAVHCLDLWNPIPHTTIESGFAQLKYKLIPAFPYIILLLLGAGGMVLCRRDVFVQSLMMLMLLNTVCNGVVAVSVRYRLVADFAFILPAAWLIAEKSRGVNLKKAFASWLRRIA